jgi:hypothetical protein
VPILLPTPAASKSTASRICLAGTDELELVIREIIITLPTKNNKYKKIKYKKLKTRNEQH